MRKNDAFVAKIVNTRLTKIFMAIFAPNERLPSPATLGQADCKKEGGGRVSPYGHPDRKISVFYDSPIVYEIILSPLAVCYILTFWESLS